MEKYVIVGGGLAGFTASREIKKLSPNSEVTIYTKEPYPYYQRPRLWEYIAGEIPQDALYFRPVEWYQEQGIRLIRNEPVQEILTGSQELLLSNGEKVSYDRLLLATGANSFLPPFAIPDPNVVALRTLEDAKKISNMVEHCKDVLVIGGGLLGLETGKALAKRGLLVKVVEYMPYLLPRQLDEEGARVLQNHLEASGIQVVASASTENIQRDNGRLSVTFKDGRKESAEMVLLSTGIRSQVELAKNANLQVNLGIVVNEHLQTSAPNIFAAGDAAEYEGTIYGIIPAAIDQGRIAAGNMVNPKSQKYPGTVPFTKLKIVGMEFNSLGESNLSYPASPNVTIVRNSDPARNIYQRVVIKDGVVVGAILLGDIKNLTPLKMLIENGRDVSAYSQRLLDPAIDLKAIAQGKPGFPA